MQSTLNLIFYASQFGDTLTNTKQGNRESKTKAISINRKYTWNILSWIIAGSSSAIESTLFSLCFCSSPSLYLYFSLNTRLLIYSLILDSINFSLSLSLSLFQTCFSSRLMNKLILINDNPKWQLLISPNGLGKQRYKFWIIIPELSIHNLLINFY